MAQFVFVKYFVSYLAHFCYHHALETRRTVGKLNPVTFCYSLQNPLRDIRQKLPHSHKVWQRNHFIDRIGLFGALKQRTGRKHQN